MNGAAEAPWATAAPGEVVRPSPATRSDDRGRGAPRSPGPALRWRHCSRTVRGYTRGSLRRSRLSTARLYRTEGIVIRRRDQGEADRVLTLCTPDGKIDVIAKGARKVRSRKAGHIELFARSGFVVSRVPNSWDIVSQADMVEPHVALRGDLVRGAYARYAVELVDGFFAQEEGGPALYDLLRHTLARMNEEEDLDTLVRYYEQRLLALAGFRPDLFRCVGDRHQQPSAHGLALGSSAALGLDADRGGCLCHGCYTETRLERGVMAVAPQVVAYLRELQKGPFNRVVGLPASPATREGTERAMYFYITHHLERNVKAIAFLQQLRSERTRAAQTLGD